jgi:hypothetical protein
MRHVSWVAERLLAYQTQLCAIKLVASLILVPASSQSLTRRRHFVQFNRKLSEYKNETQTYLYSVNSDFYLISANLDRLCGLVVRVLDYRSGGPGSIPGTNKKK